MQDHLNELKTQFSSWPLHWGHEGDKPLVKKFVDKWSGDSSITDLMKRNYYLALWFKNLKECCYCDRAKCEELGHCF